MVPFAQVREPQTFWSHDLFTSLKIIIIFFKSSIFFLRAGIFFYVSYIKLGVVSSIDTAPPPYPVSLSTVSFTQGQP